jgi:hypothetical protein
VVHLNGGQEWKDVEQRSGDATTIKQELRDDVVEATQSRNTPYN